MASMVLEIRRGIRSRPPFEHRLPAIAYYVLLTFWTAAEGINVTGDMGIAQSTPAEAIAEAQRKLERNFQPGDTIEFNGMQYASVALAVAAMTCSQTQWQ
jgi:hypothetical protein